MQEEIENKTVTLVVNGTKFTGRLLRAAISKFLAFRKQSKAQSHDVKPQGRQSVKELIIERNQSFPRCALGLSN